jgi:phosphopentomutase
MKYQRIFLVVLDGVGVGELPDADRYGDKGSNTLGNTAREVGGISVPFLTQLGLGRLGDIPGVSPVIDPKGCYGKMAELSVGKDTVTGHWEMMGVISETPFPTYPQGFPEELIRRFEAAIGRKTIGNKVASGTAVIQELGEEHMHTGSPIIYTSADSVFQIAAHESVIPLEELYRICRVARGILQGEHRVARVIARPFTGEPGQLKRTPNRKDFSVSPGQETVLDRLKKAGLTVSGIGKIEDIFNGLGLTVSDHAHNNSETIASLKRQVKLDFHGLVFANCVDFDMLYGHRNDPAGFSQALSEVDKGLEELGSSLKTEDLLVITADHGCDPVTPSTDHSREYTPLLVYGPSAPAGIDLGVRTSFTDLGATIQELLIGAPGPVGISFADKL